MPTSPVPDSAKEELIQTIRSSVIGHHDIVKGPFGDRPVVYADYTASGRALSFIEDYIRSAVLPLYANTHTESSGTGLQTSRFRDEAREIIRCSVGATSEHAVLFCGSGSTYAIAKIIGVLGLAVPSQLDDDYKLTDLIPAADRPVVFIGPYEHHSNELPWRESIADVVTIDEDADGHIDLAQLEAELIKYADRELLIGSFSAASNVTGIITDTDSVATMLHSHGALAFWDYAAAAPYVKIEMGSADDPAHADAIFISPHKLIGGPGTPGLLVARKELFKNRVPVVPGGGTVSFVNPSEHGYLADVEHREEGGTPAIIESIRAGLVFQLKDSVGAEEISRREKGFVQKAIERWSANPLIHILGSPSAERLSIVSFMINTKPDCDYRFLHHNFVVGVLNDLFGIQSRGGCSCAGPYGHRLLGIDLSKSHEFEREISSGCEGIKPGWVRLNFNYFIDDETFNYILDAVEMIAERATSLLPFYSFDATSGLWTHIDGWSDPAMSLNDISYESGCQTHPDHRQTRSAGSLESYLNLATEVFDSAGAGCDAPASRAYDSDDFEALRWFPYQSSGA